ncbi:hypothetical protein GGI15_001227 [Coemansia interrupta]|uniref:Gelsolin-like domain-containing protein n=1 Tax=Coemansia interrupta TaxID=1126814 RepID=A0A9W8LMS1_9FUNG|nr:hypothetical protein GGI15_001227 [Coemansia interrupta]
MADMGDLDCTIALASSALSRSATEVEVFSIDPAGQQFGTSSDFIAPFHSSRPASQKASRIIPQSRTVSSGSKNNYNQVRRRSPLCHDVLEFMLEGASMSSQESLPLNIATASVSLMPSADKAVRNKQHHHSSSNNTSQDPVAIYPDHDNSVIVKAADRRSVAGASSGIAGSTHIMPQSIGGRNEAISEKARRLEDSDSDEGSDAETGYDSGDGFDGKCSRSTGMISPASTAECSRSNSFKSTRSSETSDDSTATEPSLKWWKRGFRSSKSKQPAATVRIMPSISEPSRAVHTTDETMHRTLPASSRNVDQAVDTIKTADRPVTVAITDNSGSFEAQWAMFKCKGMLNLHVVSVPAAVSSLNHKDAFLLYPCLFRRINDATLATSLMQTPSPSEDGVSTGDATPVALRHSQMPQGPLLNQEYSRRKSICSFASRVIYVWVGAHASAIKRDAITRVAMEVRDKELMGKADVVIIDESADADGARRKFFAQLHIAEHGIATPLPAKISTLSSQITPLCKAGDDMDFERALERRKVLYGFWESVPPATILSVGTDINAAMLLKVPAGGVVVLDTWSDVFIWWRNEPGNSAVRKCAINFANMLVQDACIPTRPKSASVWHELRGFEHVIFKTKFPDWPFVFTSSMSSSARISRRSVPSSSGTVIPSVDIPLRPVSRPNRVMAVA